MYLDTKGVHLLKIEFDEFVTKKNQIDGKDDTKSTDIKVLQETLSRMGVIGKKNGVLTLWPSAYLIMIDGEAYLAHFKQILHMTNLRGEDKMEQNDYNRLNAIAFILKDWGLIDVNNKMIDPHDEHIDIIAYKNKREYSIDNKINTRSIDSKFDNVVI